ncbi:hypothetical protein [Oceanicaulis sp.]|uniref:hypothetical protein n=1 Tax=Oceanicaulis sp. TaxID=1924941 RepID=UPI003F7154AD
MKSVLTAGIVYVALVSGAGASGQAEKAYAQSPDPASYLGQQPPGLTPEPFAPGLVSSPGYEYGGVFSPDMDAFYFIRGRGEGAAQDFVVFKYEDENWRETVLSPRVGQPFIAPDGAMLHLGGRYMERTDAGWSDIQTLGQPFDDIQIMRLTASSAGTYVFDEIGSADGDGVLRYSRLLDGVRESPRPFSATINTGTFNAHPFIAPDESYILWDGRRSSGFGGSDIYVSFRQADGDWGPAINLGEAINTPAWEASASVTPDGQYLFFHRLVGSADGDDLPDVDIYWVDAQILDMLRPD